MHDFRKQLLTEEQRINDLTNRLTHKVKPSK